MIISVAQAQKKITIYDRYNGKTVLEIAKEHAVEAFIATKSIYQDGMTESAFVDKCLPNFPKEYYSLREVYIPYASYLFSFHRKGLTEDQVRKSVTGQEYVDCSNGILVWRSAHPGVNPEDSPWWKHVIHWAAIIFTFLDEQIPE